MYIFMIYFTAKLAASSNVNVSAMAEKESSQWRKSIVLSIYIVSVLIFNSFNLPLNCNKCKHFRPFSHDGNLRILKFNCKCAF